MNPSCNRLSPRQATRRVTQLCDRALAPLDLRATHLSMLREIDRLGLINAGPQCPLARNARARSPRRRRRSPQPSGHADAQRARPAGARAWKRWRKAQAVDEREIGAETSATLRSLLHRMAATQFSRLVRAVGWQLTGHLTFVRGWRRRGAGLSRSLAPGLARGGRPARRKQLRGAGVAPGTP
jgi:hypothetical protein